MKLHATRNDLKSNARKTSIEILNARLAEAIDLALLTKQAHWNIKGPRFIALHEMLDTFRAYSPPIRARWTSRYGSWRRTSRRRSSLRSAGRPG